MRRRVAVITHTGDAHTLITQARLRSLGHDCAVVAGDRIAGTPGLTWSLDPSSGPSVLRGSEDEEVDVSSLDLVWWRRMPPSAAALYGGWTGDAAQFVANNVRSGMVGLLLTEFQGIWLDHPDCIRRASNKLVQLRTAQSLGLRVPRSLLSQEQARIQAFADSLQTGIIAKSVASVLGVPALTGEVTEKQLADAEPLEACPVLYQELIPGRRHLRVNVYGHDVHAALIASDALDWRHPLEGDISPYEIDDELQDKLRAMLRTFGLNMGVFDLKLTDADEIVWLELNPQGQFLFVEAMGGGPLIDALVAFLEGLLDGQAVETPSSTTHAQGPVHT